jgi:hypothetical protein
MAVAGRGVGFHLKWEANIVQGKVWIFLSSIYLLSKADFTKQTFKANDFGLREQILDISIYRK